MFIIKIFSFRSINDESDTNDNASSSDTNISSMPEELLHADNNESQDNNESLGGIADGGLASFVKSSTMDDDYCMLKNKRENLYLLISFYRSSK